MIQTKTDGPPPPPSALTASEPGLREGERPRKPQCACHILFRCTGWLHVANALECMVGTNRPSSQPFAIIRAYSRAEIPLIRGQSDSAHPRAPSRGKKRKKIVLSSFRDLGSPSPARTRTPPLRLLPRFTWRTVNSLSALGRGSG